MKYTIGYMQNKNRQIKLSTFFELLRWNKPTGRIILLIPAGWSLYLTPGANPTFLMLFRIILGGLLVSGLGCVVNDIWDKKIDQKVVRTKDRPPASNKIDIKKSIELIYGVKANSVNIIRVKGKTKVFKGKVGKRSDFKKAIVSLVKGQSIDLSLGV